MSDSQPWEQVELYRVTVDSMLGPDDYYRKRDVDAARAADQAEIARLRQEIATLQTQHDEQIAEKDRQIAALRAENFELTGRIANALL